MNRILYIGLAGGFVLLIIGLSVFTELFPRAYCRIVRQGVPYTLYKYKDISLRSYGVSEGFESLEIGDGHLKNKIPSVNLWISIDDSTPIHLTSITEEHMELWVNKSKLDFYESIPPYILYDAAESSFVFDLGNNLMMAKLAYPDNIQISKNREGPYYQFPLSKKEVLDLFGSPEGVTCDCRPGSNAY